MAPILSLTRSRSTRSPGLLLADHDFNGPSLKKLRYVPGGPGGGGRYVDTEGKETPVGGTGPGGYNYAGSRGVVGRRNAANGMKPTTTPTPVVRLRRERPPARPRYSSAAAAAAAVSQNDGYKPREERGWEEFHQDLDVEADFPVFSAEDVDGISLEKFRPNTPGGSIERGISAQRYDYPATNELGYAPSPPSAALDQSYSTPRVNGDAFLSIASLGTPNRRRPGRPPRRPESMLNGLGSPPAPKITPLPAHNPRERLNLPKPSFRKVDTFAAYERDRAVQVNYVDRTMASVGYQEGDMFARPERALIRLPEGSIEEDLDPVPSSNPEGELTAGSSSVAGRVEYDMDEQDERWLEMHNSYRREEQVDAIKPAIFELTMTQIEKEWHALERRIPKPNPKPPQTHRPRSSSAAAVNGEPAGAGEEQDSKCAICDDGDCENTNAIVFCDGCDLAVHQECYGVPYIPEGQWLCRKCQLIGRGTPTCIFCPNVDGAFKQTSTSKWAHLLCAIWIPEVTLGNTTFMEPVMDVEKVPKQRWKLTCYICHQKMGACIQCGNKNCFTAFHVTCARRAKLFLKMKSTHGAPTSLDASVLKAFCDRHVPPDWRREHDVETATADAKEFYRYTMRGRRWADSQQSALAFTSIEPVQVPEPIELSSHMDEMKVISLGPNVKRKRNQPQKAVWRLPSGAPVIPQVVMNSVERALGRFTIRKKKEFIAEACKYWTLKREARRGAALLKRLQSQMDSFSSMEITRRDFAGQGAAGGPRLQRRIEFAESLEQDMFELRLICEKLMIREQDKLKDAELLRDIVDTIYFPLSPLLWPIMEKVQNLDSKGAFAEGLKVLQSNLELRYYTSVAKFSADMSNVISLGIESAPEIETTDLQIQVTSDAVGVVNKRLEQKEVRKLAKRIIKAVQGPLEEAMRKEAELIGRPFEKELRELDAIFENSLRTHSTSLSGSVGEGASDFEAEDKAGELGIVKLGGNSATNPDHNIATAQRTPEEDNADEATIRLQLPNQGHTTTTENGDARMGAFEHTGQMNKDQGPRAIPSYGGSGKGAVAAVPPTPPRSEREDAPGPLANGGIPSYLEAFNIEGTSIHDERWTGREVLRGMSEDLSEIDDEELSGMALDSAGDAFANQEAPEDEAVVVAAVKRNKARARQRRQYW